MRVNPVTLMPLYDESEDSEPEPESLPSEPFYMTMTYGVVPGFDQFLIAWETNLGGKDYSYALRGSDEETAARYDIPPIDEVPPRKLYSLIHRLVNGMEQYEDERAGELASSFLATLGFEWV